MGTTRCFAGVAVPAQPFGASVNGPTSRRWSSPCPHGLICETRTATGSSSGPAGVTSFQPSREIFRTAQAGAEAEGDDRGVTPPAGGGHVRVLDAAAEALGRRMCGGHQSAAAAPPQSVTP